MSTPHWRLRREQYLRESGRIRDLLAEGYQATRLVVIPGGRPASIQPPPEYADFHGPTLAGAETRLLPDS